MTPVARARAPVVPRESTPPLPPRAEAGPRPAIEETVAALARALESRNLARVRQVYSNLTMQQAQEWGEFFMGARNMRVSLRITSLDLLDDRAEAEIEGAYDFEDAQTGRGVRRPVAFRGTFVREGTDWRLTSLR